MGKFSADVGKWAKRSERRVTEVFRQSTQTLVEEVKKTRDEGGHMRVDTNYLRASLLASTSQMPVINPEGRPVPGQNYPDDNSQIELVIAGADLGETIYLGFTASYARPREYQDGFVRLPAQSWKQIVTQSARLVKSRVR